METNNNNPIYNDNNMHNYDNSYNGEEQLYSINRYNSNRRDYRWDGRRDYRWDNRWDDNRYYNYPDCDRYGRCRNSLWWMFWPFFFF